MKLIHTRILIAAIALLSVCLAGCTPQEDAPKIDPATAKAQPGATTAPAPTTGGQTEAQQRAAKEGK